MPGALGNPNSRIVYPNCLGSSVVSAAPGLLPSTAVLPVESTCESPGLLVDQQLEFSLSVFLAAPPEFRSITLLLVPHLDPRRVSFGGVTGVSSLNLATPPAIPEQVPPLFPLL